LDGFSIPLATITIKLPTIEKPLFAWKTAATLGTFQAICAQPFHFVSPESQYRRHGV